MVTAYGLAAAQARHVGSLNEDVVLIATLLFRMREDHPDFVPGNRNIVARLDIPILPAARIEQDSHGVSARPESPFRNSSGAWCALFLNLYERALHEDSAKPLSIGKLFVDVALIQQQLRWWWAFAFTAGTGLAK